MTTYEEWDDGVTQAIRADSLVPQQRGRTLRQPATPYDLDPDSAYPNTFNEQEA